MPSLVKAEAVRIGAAARELPCSKVATSARSVSKRAASTRSALVRTTAPRLISSRLRTARCSRVCGMMPSSAATSSRAKSMPVAPATFVCTRRSWPGALMKPIREPLSRSRKAKPRSGVMPRFLFREAIGVDAGQCADQRGFTVINMSCGTNNHENTMRGGLRRARGWRTPASDWCHVEFYRRRPRGHQVLPWPSRRQQGRRKDRGRYGKF